jgi:hypothetical protein
LPYIKPEDRPDWDAGINALSHIFDGSIGELNYIITRIVDLWLGDKPNYATFNAAIGVLECAKLELYRRRVAPYEDTKIAQNGDVR